MSGTEPRPRACETCLRRRWLLAELGPVLDHIAHDRARLCELLVLGDGELIRAVGGRRRSALTVAHERFRSDARAPRGDREWICRHDRGYPAALCGAGCPHMLEVCAGAGRLAQVTAQPVVAVVGGARASDYGVETAWQLGRGLAAAGVTVAGGMADGIVSAALEGALATTGGRVLAVLDGGADVGCPARRRALLDRVGDRGCAVAELPADRPGRRWGAVARERTVAALAALTIVVEAEASARDLAAATLARAFGREVAAVPGRVTSPLSAGPNALLHGGAALVRGPADALELLSLRGRVTDGGAGTGPLAALEPRLRTMLERVGCGSDTPEKLCGEGSDLDAVLLALSELEVMGLLGRGDGGRYLPRVGYP
jgi:DNA processing protein